MCLTIQTGVPVLRSSEMPSAAQTLLNPVPPNPVTLGQLLQLPHYNPSIGFVPERQSLTDRQQKSVEGQTNGKSISLLQFLAMLLRMSRPSLHCIRLSLVVISVSNSRLILLCNGNLDAAASKAQSFYFPAVQERRTDGTVNIAHFKVQQQLNFPGASQIVSSCFTLDHLSVKGRTRNCCMRRSNPGLRACIWCLGAGQGFIRSARNIYIQCVVVVGRPELSVEHWYRLQPAKKRRSFISSSQVRGCIS